MRGRLGVKREVKKLNWGHDLLLKPTLHHLKFQEYFVIGNIMCTQVVLAHTRYENKGPVSSSMC